MFLKSLQLTHFRNYSNLELHFDNRPTIFLGDNAAGKSNILEAVYLLSTTKSLRAQNEDELIKETEEFAKIEGFIIFGEAESELLIILNRITDVLNFKKKVLVNGIPRKAVDFMGNLPAVIFYPLDINMVTGSPSLRRWHIDLCLAQVDPQYKKAITVYEHFLTSRNKVLKRIREGKGRVDELDYWTQEVIEKGEEISKKRKEFFVFINSLEKPLGDFMFEYLPSEISLEKLNLIQSREIASAQTLIGPHRDDFSLILSGRKMANFGSRGEQRTATLAFKLSQLEYMAKILGKRPMLLLDDVFSELDASHRAHIVEIVSKQQTLIATVELENIPKEFLASARILKVEEGKIIDNKI